MFKKLLLVLTGFVLAMAVFGVAGFAYAQTQDPPDPDALCPYCGTGEGYTGRGGGMSQGSRGGMMNATYDGEYGPMHEFMLAGFAEAFGLSVDELEARRAAGETMWQVAEAQGYSLEEFSALMFEIRSAALEQAVAAGLITQEQADWMLSRWESMQAGGFGTGTGSGPCQGGTPRGGMGGRGGGRWSGSQ